MRQRREIGEHAEMAQLPLPALLGVIVGAPGAGYAVRAAAFTRR
jgi:hypothetical protein